MTFAEGVTQALPTPHVISAAIRHSLLVSRPSAAALSRTTTPDRSAKTLSVLFGGGLSHSFLRLNKQQGLDKVFNHFHRENHPWILSGPRFLGSTHFCCFLSFPCVLCSKTLLNVRIQLVLEDLIQDPFMQMNLPVFLLVAIFLILPHFKDRLSC